MRRIERIAHGGSTIHILPVIRGLTSEVEPVRKAFAEVKPDLMAISLCKEELDGLRRLPSDYEPELSRYDEIYVTGLARYGEVAAPPPCYVAAVEIADSEKIPVIPIDVDEESYTELYCASISGSALFRDSTRTWLLRKRAFSADTAEEYVTKFDRAVNNMRGFRRIEDERVDWMVRELLKTTGKAKDPLAVVEYERAAEVAAGLSHEEPS
ncbi:MAG: hypothetical protein JSV90_02590 [Methanobacteriota archaeon]|nr:MAG: hypothetical protein JSV90_02590 [Euryarchaeota archaeon]